MISKAPTREPAASVIKKGCGDSTAPPDLVNPFTNPPAPLKRCPTTYLITAGTAEADLLDKEHLSVRGQRPRLVRNHELERVARFAQRRHRRHDRVAEVFRVLFRRAVAFML